MITLITWILAVLVVLSVVVAALVLGICWIAAGSRDVNGEPERDAAYVAAPPRPMSARWWRARMRERSLAWRAQRDHKEWLDRAAYCRRMSEFAQQLGRDV